jgi:hypothetical protein
MDEITQIDWRMHAGSPLSSGTESPIWIEMYRDETLLRRASIEPGPEPRLDGEIATYYYRFPDPDPVEFPHGVRGHLRVRLLAHGRQAWDTVDIVSTVHSGELSRESFGFSRDVVLGTDQPDGFQNWTLSY